MVKFVAINKHGVPGDVVVNSMDKLYKKCKFRKKEDFENRHTWCLFINKKKVYVHLFAKNKGQHVNINKYELPPPIESDLFYGTVAVVASEDNKNEKSMDMTLALWKQIYEKLMGGFEDLDNDDNEEEEEFIPAKYRTKQGYSKETNFVVDDGNIEYNSSSSSPEEEEYEFSDCSDDVDSKSDNEGVPEDEFVTNDVDVSEDEGQDVEEENPDSELSEEEYEQEN